MKACLLLLVVLGAVQAQDYTVHQCARPDLIWSNPNACVVLDPNPPDDNTQVYAIQPCSSPQLPYCPGGTPTSTTPVLCTAAPASPVITPGSLPGDLCRSASDCGDNGECVMGFCGGSVTCDSDKDCNPGYYCLDETTKTCTAVLAIGETCTTDDQCPIQSGCNKGTCTTFFSVKNGDAVSDCGLSTYTNFPNPGVPNIYYSIYCSSGTCNADKATCAAAMMTSSSTVSLPVSCDPSGQTPNQCPSSNGAGGLTGNTACTESLNGKFYCGVDMGDSPYLEFLSWVTNTYIPLAGKNPGICHTTERGLMPSCLALLGGQYLINQYNYYFNSATKYARYANADYCAMNVYASEVTGPMQSNNFCDTTFTCASNTTQLAQPLTCIQQDSTAKNYLIKPCTDYANSYCYNSHFYTLANEVNCMPPFTSVSAISPAYPGDLCTRNSDCPSYNCNMGVCAGTVANGNCKSDIDCNPGLYCDMTQNQSICVPLIAIGNSCTATTQCVMNAGCNESNNMGTCVQYYTVKDGQTVSDCGTQTIIPTITTSASILMGGASRVLSYSSLCASGTCTLSQNLGQNTGMCIAAYQTTLTTTPLTCTFLKTDCPVSNGEKLSQTYSSCGCGRSTGTRYCALELGDTQFTPLMTFTNNYFGKIAGTTQCHTNRRGLDTVCMKNIESGGMNTTMNYYVAYFEATHNQLIQDAPVCSLQVFFPDYWAAKQYNAHYAPPVSKVGKKEKFGGVEELLG